MAVRPVTRLTLAFLEIVREGPGQQIPSAVPSTVLGPKSQGERGLCLHLTQLKALRETLAFPNRGQQHRPLRHSRVHLFETSTSHPALDPDPRQAEKKRGLQRNLEQKHLTSPRALGLAQQSPYFLPKEGFGMPQSCGEALDVSLRTA